MDYVVLEAEANSGGWKQVIVEAEDYTGNPADYFPAGRYHNERKVGEIQIVDNDGLLKHPAYESCL